MNSPSNLCPACAAVSRKSGYVTISPWVRELARLKARSSRLYICPDCGTGSFSYRYDDSEMNGIYSKYRGPAYFQVRNAWEPTYTKELNDDMGVDPEVLNIRQRVIASAAERHENVIPTSIQCVVDIGGDQGQFIPSKFKNKFVLEVSDSILRPGIRRITTQKDLLEIRPDLVLLCGILEHVESPQRFLKEIKENLADTHPTLIYIEVPYGVPQQRGGLNHFIGWLIAQIFVRTRVTWKMLDNYVSFQRRKQRIDKFKILRQSEHINFFTEEGLNYLASGSELKVLEIFTYEMATKLAATGRLEFSRVLCAMMVKL